MVGWGEGHEVPEGRVRDSLEGVTNGERGDNRLLWVCGRLLSGSRTQRPWVSDSSDRERVSG